VHDTGYRIHIIVLLLQTGWLLLVSSITVHLFTGLEQTHLNDFLCLVLMHSSGTVRMEDAFPLEMDAFSRLRSTNSMPPSACYSLQIARPSPDLFVNIIIHDLLCGDVDIRCQEMDDSLPKCTVRIRKTRHASVIYEHGN